LVLDGETGLIYNRARALHPVLGRFLQRDPLGYVDGMSTYMYQRGAPLASHDPRGLYRERTGCCGPDVEALLYDIRNEINKQFMRRGRLDRNRLCDDLVNPWVATDAWDIYEFWEGSAYSAGCGSGSGDCQNTVTIGKRCYPQGDVNYWLLGAAAKACIDHGYPVHFRWVLEFEIGLHTWIISGRPHNKGSWYSAGYNGDARSLPAHFDLGWCSPCTGPKATAKKLSGHWGKKGTWRDIQFGVVP
jgi:RHS repeat-associated protein